QRDVPHPAKLPALSGHSVRQRPSEGRLLTIFSFRRGLTNRQDRQVESFISQGHFARHLSRMRTRYTERRMTLGAAIESTMIRYVEFCLIGGRARSARNELD